MTMLTPLRNAAKSVARPIRDGARRVADRLFHGRRRRRALATVQRVGEGKPALILFICYGNICRSPYAAYSAARLMQGEHADRFKIVSAGYFGPDRASPDNAVAAARALGVDLTPHRSQLLTDRLIREADLIVAMEPMHRDRLTQTFGVPRAPILMLGELDPDASVPPAIADPDGLAVEFFDDTYRRIDRCVAELIGIIRGPVRT